MKKKLVKKIAIYSASAFGLLVLILCIHIYMVTRPKAPDAQTRIMARIDIKKQISKAEADQITAWMYQQKGIDHVLCNPESDILVFTYSPLQTNANQVLTDFKAGFRIPAERVVPTESEMKSGCPVAANSVSYKAYSLIRKII